MRVKRKFYGRALEAAAASAHYGATLIHQCPMPNEVDPRVVELETRLAFQEQSLQALNDALVAQHRQLEVLSRTVDALKERLLALEPSPVGPRADEPPPPHY